MADLADNGKPRIAIVLPGGGARGAYEAGALGVLLPALEARGERATIICGTSVGAINTALLGSVAHLTAEEQAEVALGTWRRMRLNNAGNFSSAVPSRMSTTRAARRILVAFFTSSANLGISSMGRLSTE